ncbi:MAG: Ig-like domain-containing protein [Erysipelotrichaceae bacterium]|nr:Ig-like domain-containing protein [Erysipelotrichaceae bacterium]
MAKFCPKCGAELADDMAFCPKCGYKLEADEPVEEKKPEEAVEKAPKKETKKAPKKEPEAVVEKAPEKEEKKNKALIFIILGLVLLAIIGGLLFFMNRKYTVSFDTDGGTPIAEVKVAKGEPVARPADPSKEGFDFAGWSYNGKDYNFNDPVTQSLTLKAQWLESKYVTFIVDGNQIAREHIINGRVTFPQAPDLEGYSFVGWQDETKAEVTEENIFTDNTTLTANYKVYVPVTSIKYEKSAYEIEKGSTLKPKLVIAPTGWAEYLSYTTSDANVATVEPDGTITAHNAGKATITVNTESGKSAKTEITVVISCKSVKFAKSEITINKGETVKLEYTIDPADTTDSISFGTSDKKVVKPVDVAGTITGIDYGTATISLKCGDQKATITVHVANPATSVTINASNIELVVGETYDLGKYVEVKPKDTTSKITYTSSDTSVFTVSSKGKITAVGQGTATITVKTDNGKEDSCGVTVSEYKLNVDYEKHGVSAYYLYYTKNNRPYYTLKNLSISVNGKVVTTSVDQSKLKLVTPNDILYYSSTSHELYCTNRGTTDNLPRTQTFTIYFTYTYDGHTIKSDTLNIVVEPMLEIKFYGYGTYNADNGQYNLPAEAGTHEFVIEANQKLASWTPSSNLTIVATETPTPVAGKPAYFDIGCRYSKTASSSPASITLKTPAGQKIEIKYIR